MIKKQTVSRQIGPDITNYGLPVLDTFSMEYYYLIDVNMGAVAMKRVLTFELFLVRVIAYYLAYWKSGEFPIRLSVWFVWSQLHTVQSQIANGTAVQFRISAFGMSLLMKHLNR